MSGFETLNINLLGMKEDSMGFSCRLDDGFFEGLDDVLIQHGNVEATVSIRKAGSDAFALQIGVRAW